jgi:hypothetical protein
MVRKIMQWVLLSALLLAMVWRPSANYQILLHFAVCAGAILVILALISINHRVESEYAFYSSHVGKHVP